MRQLYGNVDGPLPAAQEVEVLGKRLPTPLHPFVQRGAGNVLDPFHQLDEPALLAGANRREADAAVPGHDRRDTVRARRLEHVVPGGLPVVVRVRVDETRRDDASRGVDRLRSLRGIDRRLHGDNAPVSHRDIGPHDRATCPVDDFAAADDHVVHAREGIASRGKQEVPKNRRALALFSTPDPTVGHGTQPGALFRPLPAHGPPQPAPVARRRGGGLLGELCIVESFRVERISHDDRESRLLRVEHDDGGVRELATATGSVSDGYVIALTVPV